MAGAAGADGAAAGRVNGMIRTCAARLVPSARGVAAVLIAGEVAILLSVGCARPEASDSNVRAPGDGGSAAVEPVEAAPDVLDLSDDEVRERIARLRAIIIPPVGTFLSQVDRVFGRPRVEEALRPGAKGSPADYPMHIYDLLPPEGRAEFRAFLHVTNHNDVVARAAINHHSVVKGRAAGPRAAGQERVLRAEQRRVLADLEAIREKYRVQLRSAEWAR